MAWKKDEEEDLNWASCLKALADLIRILIYVAIGVWWIIEFVFNPNRNVSTYFLAEHTYGMAVQCREEYQRWELRVDTIEDSATVTRWKVSREGITQSEETVEITEKNDLTFPCGDEEVVAGLVWSVDQEEGIHFRAPRSFEIWEVEKER